MQVETQLAVAKCQTDHLTLCSHHWRPLMHHCILPSMARPWLFGCPLSFGSPWSIRDTGPPAPSPSRQHRHIAIHRPSTSNPVAFETGIFLCSLSATPLAPGCRLIHPIIHAPCPWPGRCLRPDQDSTPSTPRPPSANPYSLCCTEVQPPIRGNEMPGRAAGQVSLHPAAFPIHPI